jgi:hypothetical protein
MYLGQPNDAKLIGTIIKKEDEYVMAEHNNNKNTGDGVAQNKNFWAINGFAMVDNGYDIVPILSRQKHPQILKWQDTHFEPEVDYLGHQSIGIKCAEMAVIDLDIRDRAITNHMLNYIRDEFNGKGEMLVRVGESPKAAVLTQCSGIKKFKSVAFECESGKCEIEVLGDGQQLVAFGIHPDTKEEYQWIGPKKKSPANTRSNELLDLTVSNIQSIITEFNRYCREIGLKVLVGNNLKPISTNCSSKIEVKQDDSVKNEEVVEEFDNYKRKVDISDDELLRILSDTCDGSDYHQWVRVGIALHHQFSGGNAGLDIFDEWSEQYDNYDGYDRCKKLWKSFKRDLSRSQLTMRTYIKMDRDRKRKEKSGKIVPIGGDEESGGDTKRDYISQYAFISAGNKVADMYRTPHSSVFNLDEFKNTMKWDYEEIVGKQGGVKRIYKTESWLCDSERKTCRDVGYLPGGSQIYADAGEQYYNKFCFPIWNILDGSCLDGRVLDDEVWQFIEHIHYLVNDKVDAEKLIDWIAHLVQKPHERPKIVPMLISKEHGTGRGWLVELIDKLIGCWNSSTCKMTELAEGVYHDYLYESLFCAIHETRAVDKKFSVDDKIRDVLVEGRLNLNLKYGTKGVKRVFTRFLLMSNHLDALNVGIEDRRLWVMINHLSVKTEDYYNNLYDWIDCIENIELLFNWLKQRDISGFNAVGRAVDSKDKRLLQNMIVDDDEDDLNELGLEDDIELMTFAMIKAKLDFTRDDNSSDKRLSYMLRNKYVKYPKKISINKIRHSIWILDNKNFWLSADSDKVKAYLANHS